PEDEAPRRDDPVERLADLAPQRAVLGLDAEEGDPRRRAHRVPFPSATSALPDAIERAAASSTRTTSYPSSPGVSGAAPSRTHRRKCATSSRGGSVGSHSGTRTPPNRSARYSPYDP